MKIWRIGMIGAGAYSEKQLTAWDSVRDAKVIALCDRHPDRRDSVASRFQIKHKFSDADEMLNSIELDAIDICTRPYSHSSLIRSAADRGKPILCQKPFCKTLAEAREIVDYCNKLNIRLMINENYRWQKWYRKVKRLLQSHQIGNPFFARHQVRRSVTYPKFNSSQQYFAEMPQLIVYEYTIHFLDTIRFLFGNPRSVYARHHRISPLMLGEDVEITLLTYENMTVEIATSWASRPILELDEPTLSKMARPDAPRMEIDGTEGTLYIKCDGTVHLYTDQQHKKWEFHDAIKPESRRASLQHFINCLNHEDEFETSGSAYLGTMALVYACYRAAGENRVVNLSEILD